MKVNIIFSKTFCVLTKSILLIALFLICKDSLAQKDINKRFYEHALDYLDRPYEEKILDKYKGEQEQLIVNFDSLDCFTFVELAIASFLKESSGNQYSNIETNIKLLRYNDDDISYCNRNHYSSYWLYRADSLGFLRIKTQDFKDAEPFKKRINYMTSHAQLYPKLSQKDIPVIEGIEKYISSIPMMHIPKERVGNIESSFKAGDIVVITTSIKGLDAVHMGIVGKQDGKTVLLHASSDSKKVVMTTIKLSDYLNRYKLANGIMIAGWN